MLHAHASENIQHFTKHLVATFLGLLMALGLEQWAEHRRETHNAHAFLEHIKEDLDQNVEYCKEMNRKFKVCREFDANISEQIKAVLAARKRGGKVPPIVQKGCYRSDFIFHTSAWDAAKASGALQHLPPKLVQDLSSNFEVLKRIQVRDDESLNSVTVSAFVAHFHDNWNQLESKDLEGVLGGLTLLKGICADQEQVCLYLLPELEKARKEVEAAMHT